MIVAVVTTYQSDCKIMERTCRCIRFILRNLSRYTICILTPLVTLVYVIYSETSLYQDTSINRTLSSVSNVTFVYLTTSEMRTPHYSGQYPPSLSPSISLPPSPSSQAVQTYRTHHQSCFLYLGSVIVDEFGSDPNYQQGIKPSGHHLIRTPFN